MMRTVSRMTRKGTVVSRRKSVASPSAAPGQFKRFGARVLDDPQHDPYQAGGKIAEPTHCATCGAVYKAGRWRWGDAAADSAPTTCPACKRIRERLPAGWLILDGEYVALHGPALIQIARAQEDQQRDEHPLHRIMDVASTADRIEITTTDIHLPRRIGEALKRAHDGDLAVTFSEDAYEIRVHWHR